jgi:hypothetical protein
LSALVSGNCNLVTGRARSKKRPGDLATSDGPDYQQRLFSGRGRVGERRVG